VQAPIAYNACTMSKQYTLRAIPPAIDQALRRLARQEHRSLNAVALEALARGLNLGSEPPKFTDLDDLIGTWEDDPAFNDAVAAFELVDEDAWR